MELVKQFPAYIQFIDQNKYETIDYNLIITANVYYNGKIIVDFDKCEKGNWSLLQWTTGEIKEYEDWCKKNDKKPILRHFYVGFQKRVEMTIEEFNATFCLLSYYPSAKPISFQK